MRLIMLGTGPFSVPTLHALAGSRHDVVIVVTRPATGRRLEVSPLQRAGEALGLAVWSPDTVNSAESQSRLASLAADLLVVCDYGEILRPDTLATARLARAEHDLSPAGSCAGRGHAARRRSGSAA